MGFVRTKDLVGRLNMNLLAGEKGLDRKITTSEISRPGIEMTGYFAYYASERLQLIGRKEMSYFLELDHETRQDRLKRMFTDETPAVIIARGMEVPEEFIEAGNKYDMPIFHSPLKTTRVIGRLTNHLEAKFAPFTAVHGVLLDIYGVGVLITGKSGIGKSETALELVKRGHRLVADDSVEIRQEDYENLIGTAPNLIEHLLEIRGLGIINVMTLFGAGSVRRFKKINMIIDLEEWVENKQYNRLGLEDETAQIMDVTLPKATVPIRPGRNLAVIIEVAAMNFRVKLFGLNPAEEFSDRLTSMIEQGKHDLE
ncbi:HPr(Ser) kinase/phosphatase [Aciduricibacillus chroicocephali]|uniref:HPr kinase/phosphorylase n=1 Tax=Aciduricibacillus chroicocephali TaxID=3054939 RepID=A0ABY9KTT4_9BACI|nr:HPr(Ser) kinase/phosphatase [Bacillaceae bacterium 44XB]